MTRFVAFLCVAAAMLFAHISVEAAVFVVTKTADTADGTCNADCSLREAIAAANGVATNDEIIFALPLFSSPQTITLASGELAVAANGSLTIYGTGAHRLTLNGNNASRILVSGANVVVNIHNIRFTGGNGVGTLNSGRGGAVYNVGGTMLLANSILIGNSAANGGALNNAASTAPAVPANLTILNCALSNNSSTSSGAALQNFSTSFLHMVNTTVNNNNTTGTGIAGAFQANGMITISNSTFSGNTAAGTGGGIYYNGTGLQMNNVTVAGNTSTLGSGGFHKSTATLNANVRNSIFAGNTGAAGTGDALGPVSSQGNNIIQAVGTSTGWIMSDLQNINPLIAPFGFYGGIGMTYALLVGSPAIDAGQPCVTDLTCAVGNPPVALTTDQRGAARSGVVDIGAYEHNSAYIARLPSAQFNFPYNQVLAPNVGAFTYSVSSGSTPPGITVNTGGVAATIGGTPTANGAFNFGVNVTNGANSTVVNYVLNVSGDPLSVPVTGRVLTAGGDPVKGATVVITDLTGNTQYTLTNGFGYFHFANVLVGGTYDVTVSSKQYSFAPLRVTIVDATTDLTLSAAP